MISADCSFKEFISAIKGSDYLFISSNFLGERVMKETLLLVGTVIILIGIIGFHIRFSKRRKPKSGILIFPFKKK